jgi:hypothetical protein
MQIALIITGLVLASGLVACGSEQEREPRASQSAKQRSAGKCVRAADGASQSGGVGGRGGLSGNCPAAAGAPKKESGGGSGPSPGTEDDCWALLGSTPGPSEWSAFGRCVEEGDVGSDDPGSSDVDGSGHGEPGLGGPATCEVGNAVYICEASGQAGARCDAPQSSPNCRRIN